MELELINYNRKKRRNAEFIDPPNVLREKAGFGGIGDDVLEKAQRLLENSDVDFAPLAELYLDSMMRAVNAAKEAGPADDSESLIANILYQAVQLKAHGGMFQYILISKIADRLVQFLEVIDTPDIESIEIVLAFYTTIKAVIKGNIKDDGGKHGDQLIAALNAACLRYFENS